MSIISATKVSNWEFGGFDQGLQERTDPDDATKTQSRDVSVFRRFRFVSGMNSYTPQFNQSFSSSAVKANFGSTINFGPSSTYSWKCTRDSLNPAQQGSGIWLNEMEFTQFGPWVDMPATS